MLNDFIDKLNETIYWMDVEGRITRCNDKQAQLFGLACAEDLIGKNIFDVAELLGWPQTLAQAIHDHDQQVMQQGHSTIAEESVILNGEEHIFLARKHPWVSNNKIIGIIGIGIDITEKKRAEQLQLEKEKAEQYSSAMYLLASAIAHELRTPLAGISAGLTGLENHLPSLLSGFKQAQTQQLPVPHLSHRLLALLEQMPASVMRQTRYAHLFIDMMLVNIKGAAITSNTFERLSIADTIINTLASYPFHPDERKLVSYQGNCDFCYYGNSLLTMHVLYNLLKNALFFIKAANKGEITIEVVPHLRQVVFTDTGTGISATVLPKIFDRFFSNRDSTGIGLAFCKMVMHAYQGDICCESQLHAYTRFTLTFGSEADFHWIDAERPSDSTVSH